MEALGRPRFRRAGLLDSCCGSWFASSLELDRREHAKRGVSTPAIMDDLEVFEDRVGEFYAVPPTYGTKLDSNTSNSEWPCWLGDAQLRSEAEPDLHGFARRNNAALLATLS